MPPRHPSIAQALGLVRRRLSERGRGSGAGPESRIHVACSGGADSIAMLGLLQLLAGRDGLRLTVGHVDHGLRPESSREAALVVEVARGMGLPVEVTRLTLESGAGLPARARAARRDALRQQAERHGARCIALGHTATDQAETILLHLVRGAALEGLAAMAGFDPWPDALGGWVRPLLDLPRPETRAVAERLALPFVDDPTNEDREHPRVRIRHEVLPVLQTINPRVESSLARAATHARDADEALDAWVDQLLRSRRRAIAPGEGSADEGSAHTGPERHDPAAVTPTSRWSTEGMSQLPRAVRTRFVRRVLRAAGSPSDALSAQTLASIDDALRQPGPHRRWDLHPHLRLCIAGGELWVEPAKAREPRGQPLTP